MLGRKEAKKWTHWFESRSGGMENGHDLTSWHVTHTRLWRLRAVVKWYNLCLKTVTAPSVSWGTTLGVWLLSSLCTNPVVKRIPRLTGSKIHSVWFKTSLREERQWRKWDSMRTQQRCYFSWQLWQVFNHDTFQWTLFPLEDCGTDK